MPHSESRLVKVETSWDLRARLNSLRSQFSAALVSESLRLDVTSTALTETLLWMALFQPHRF